MVWYGRTTWDPPPDDRQQEERTEGRTEGRFLNQLHCGECRPLKTISVDGAMSSILSDSLIFNGDRVRKCSAKPR